MAQARIEPASQELVVRSLSSALVLTAPAGFSEGDRKAWLAAATMTLKGIPADLLERGLIAARKAADHPSKIVPAIMEAVEAEWTRRRDAVRSELAAEAAKRQRLAEPEIVPCTPEQAAAIIEEFGLRRNPLEMIQG